MYDENKHTKLIEVPQQRIWRRTSVHEYAYVWEDGYDGLAYVRMVKGRWLWYTTASYQCGFADSMEAAMAATGFPLKPGERF